MAEQETNAKGKVEVSEHPVFPGQVLNDIIVAFNSVTKVLYFEHNENVSQMIVYRMSVNHIYEEEVSMMEFCRNHQEEYSGFNVEPADIDAKYEIELNTLGTKKLIIYIYNFRGDKVDKEKNVYLIKPQTIFESDANTVYVFLPLNYVDEDAIVSNRFYAYSIAYRGIFYDISDTKLISLFKDIMAEVFASTLVTYKNADDKEGMIEKYYNQFTNFITIDNISGSPVINCGIPINKSIISSLDKFMRDSYNDIASHYDYYTVLLNYIYQSPNKKDS